MHGNDGVAGMTCDIVIGKITAKIPDNWFEEGSYGEACFEPPDAYYVEKCPDADHDISSQEATIASPREAIRYMASSPAYKVFVEGMPEIWEAWFESSQHDMKGIGRIKPAIDKINKIPLPDDFYEKDRMIWFKYWCNKAVELYGEYAGIEFS